MASPFKKIFIDNDYEFVANGDGLDIFKVLGNKNRRRILELLFEKEIHINGLAKELGISAPVVFKHVKLLEEHNLIERRKVGNTHLLKICDAYVDKIRKAFFALEKDYSIEVKAGDTLLEAFNKISGIKIKKSVNGYLIESIDGKKGYFLFKVNGQMPNRSIEKIVLKKDAEISFFYLMPVLGKSFAIKVK